MINKPSSFAFCLLTNDSILSKKQIDNVKNSPIAQKYEIEYWERAYKNPNQYVGFSHMINEAIDDTDNEFMIFLSGKIETNPEEIEDIIEKLCSGYCFVAPMSLGFFGVTKELFRAIGMMDERFLGGEMEDDDLAMRINKLDKAVYWLFDESRYSWSKGNYPLIRGTATGEFFKKWNINPLTMTAFISNQNTEKQISPRHSKRNLDIYNSWKNKEYSIYKHQEGFPGTKAVEYKIQLIDYTPKQVICGCDIKIKIENKNTFYAEFITDNTQTYPITAGIYEIDGDKRYPIRATEIYPNRWCSFDFNLQSDLYEIRIYGDGNIIYNNIIDKENFETSINLNIFRNICPL
jgi:hypothetical protein